MPAKKPPLHDYPGGLKKKKNVSMADNAKNKMYQSQASERCLLPPKGVVKKQKKASLKTANGALGAASKSKIIEHLKHAIPATGTGVAKKQKSVSEKTANGALDAASKSKIVEQEKRTDVVKKQKSVSPKTAKGAPDAASKPKIVEQVKHAIPTTSKNVAKKQKSVSPKTANGAPNGASKSKIMKNCTIPTTSAVKKRNSVTSKIANGASKSSTAENPQSTPPITGVAKKRKCLPPSGTGNGSAKGQRNGAKLASGLPPAKKRPRADEDEEESPVSSDGDGEEAIDDLMRFFFQQYDMKKKLKGHKKSLAVPKKVPAIKASMSGWIEEDNDQEVPAVAKKSLVHGTAGKVAKFEPHSAEVDSLEDEESLEDEYSLEDEESLDEEEEDEWYDDDFSDQTLDSNSDMWTDESEDQYSESSYNAYSEDSDDIGLNYLHESYDSDSYDDDYSPSDSEYQPGVHIPRGMAQIYDIDDDSVPFDEGVSQIIEIPCRADDTKGKRMIGDALSDAEADSDTTIPELVPIYSERGEFIDSPEKLNRQPEPTEPAKAATVGESEAEQVVAPQEATETDEKEAEEQTANGSTEDDIELDDCSDIADEEAMEKEINQRSSHCRFYDAIDGHMALAVLQQEIFFYGHLSVQALAGRVDIMGYLLEAGETRTVYAARGYNAVNLTPLPSTFIEPSAGVALEKALEKLQPKFVEADIRELMESFDPTQSVLVLLRSDHPDASLVPIVCNYLKEYSLFPTVNNLTGLTPFRRTELLLEVEFFTPAAVSERTIAVFQRDPAWDDVPLCAASRLLVAGGKGAGKSTLCQFLVNRHLRQFGRILLVDLDIGQPLLHLPETINASVLHEPILGVGCWAKVQPLRSLLFGSLNVVSSPQVYIQNVRTLVQHCEADPDLKGVPWIVNTMGYTTGFGEELMAAIIRLVQPTDLIQLTIPRHVRGTQNYGTQQTDSHVNGYKFNILKEEMGQLSEQQQQLTYRFHQMVVSFDQRGGGPLHAPKRRTLSIMTQLVQILGDSNEWFTDIKPFSAPLDDLQILITRDEYTPSKDMLPHILNAMMVYLCERLDSGQYNCLGVGIVRAVDQNNNVHLLHYLPPEQLARAKVLALCNTCLPSEIYLRLNNKTDGTVPYLQNVGSS